jgi:hypothetical protein
MNSRLPEDTQCIALVITQAQATSFMQSIGLSLQSFTFNASKAVDTTVERGQHCLRQRSISLGSNAQKLGKP